MLYIFFITFFIVFYSYLCITVNILMQIEMQNNLIEFILRWKVFMVQSKPKYASNSFLRSS